METGIKAVVKKKRPLLSKRHQKERIEFTVSHQYWMWMTGRGYIVT